MANLLGRTKLQPPKHLTAPSSSRLSWMRSIKKSYKKFGKKVVVACGNCDALIMRKLRNQNTGTMIRGCVKCGNQHVLDENDHIVNMGVPIRNYDDA